MTDLKLSGRRSLTFSGVPAHASQKSWKYVLTPDEKNGGGTLTIIAGDRHLRWKLPEEISTAESTPITRLPDPSSADKAIKGHSGSLQVHKSSSGEIYATMQDGKSNSSIRLSQDNGKWSIKAVEPKKSTGSSAIEFISKLTKKEAAQDFQGITHAQPNIFDTLSYPLTSHSTPLGMLAGAGVGAVGGGLLNIVRKIKNKITGKSNELEPSVAESALTGAGLGAAVSGGYHLLDNALGGPRIPNSIPSSYPDLQVPKPSLDTESIDEGQMSADRMSSKMASFGKRAYDIDYRAIAANIRTDPALAPFERDNLLNDVHRASMSKIPVDPQTLIAAGFSALASYILSRIFNAGTFGRAAVTALGGFLGGYAFAPDPDTTRTRGGIYTYE